MTLIPLISALAAAPERAPAPAGTPAPGARYEPGAGHRPLAALFAFGVPAALVVAVTLSPMIIERTPTSAPVPWKSFTLPPAPPPEPQPQPPRAEPQPSAMTTTVSPLPPVAVD
ncbi:MAG: energy transducer TonB, partial [Sphingopyxis granuli]